jgi:hypothetical protein
MLRLLFILVIPTVPRSYFREPPFLLFLFILMPRLTCTLNTLQVSGMRVP